MGTTLDQPIHSDRVLTRELASDVARMYIGFVNVYLLGAPTGPWVLVDTGIPYAAGLIRQRAEARFGARAPEAIVLTHGHFDHAGSALALAELWGVPVYAHPMELPYLTGCSDYPPQDPTVGGALGLMSRVFPTSGRDLGDHVRALPADGTVPGMRGWTWIHTPGHTAGHVSLYRERDRFLIAGDALATVDQDSPLSMLNLRTEFSVPPAPLTSDWTAARASVRGLAALSPYTIAAGHGRPVRGTGVALDLRVFSNRFSPPRRGRYSLQPAITDEDGVVSVPPAVPDPLPRQLLVAGLVAGGLYLAFRARDREERAERRRRRLRRLRRRRLER